MSEERPRTQFSITLSGALFGFSAATMLWCLAWALDTNPLVPGIVGDVVIVAGMALLAVRLRRWLKR